jgi:acetylornithine deacetylase
MSAPTLEAAVESQVAKHADEATGLLEELVRINSVNPNFAGVERASVIGGETACNEILATRYEALGLEIHWVAPDPERRNLVAVARGSGSGRSLIVNGHVDTVPPVDPQGWASGNPWEPTRDGNGRLFGLGATDMKAGHAATWLAVRALRESGIRLGGDLQLHCVVGEETWEHELGTTACVQAGFRADAAVVTEPTSFSRPLGINVISAGLWHLKVLVRGLSTHAGNRPLAIRPGGPGDAIGVNALEKGIIVVRAIQELETEWGMTKRHPYFSPGFFNLLPGVFYSDAGYPLPYFFPDHAEIHYDVWHAPDESADEVAAEIERFVLHACGMDTWLRDNPPVFEWVKHYPPMQTDWEHPLAQALVRAYERVTDTRYGNPSPQNPVNFGAALDATWLQQTGIPCVAFGPGEVRIAHCKDEYVDVQEIVDAARILALAIVDWCGTAEA